MKKKHFKKYVKSGKTVKLFHLGSYINMFKSLHTFNNAQFDCIYSKIIFCQIITLHFLCSIYVLLINMMHLDENVKLHQFLSFFLQRLV